MKNIYVAFTEKGRVKGKITVGILKKNEKFNLIHDFSFSSTSNRGNKAEIIAELVKIGELPIEALDKSDYPNYPLVNQLAEILLIEGDGLNYYSTI